MSADNIVAEDYGLSSDTGVTKNDGPERRIWENVQVAPDPTQSGYFYVVQKLAGEWKRVLGEPIPAEALPDGFRPWELKWVARSPELPPKTRILYCRMNDYGQIENVYKWASQGKKEAGE